MKMNYGKLYNESDRKVMKLAEDSLNPKADRVTEIIGFAREAGFRKIGIANCVTFEKEAEELKSQLVENGFEVFRANCKLGKMPNEEIIPGYSGVSCNPAGQAQHLDECNTEMNIVMGLCLGHDMVFNAKSKVPTTHLLVKDRKFNHNPIIHFNSE